MKLLKFSFEFIEGLVLFGDLRVKVFTILQDLLRYLIQSDGLHLINYVLQIKIVISNGRFCLFKLLLWTFLREWLNGTSDTLNPLISFDLILCFKSQDSEFLGVGVNAVYLEYLDLLLVVRESDLLLPVTLRQVDALARLPLFISIFEIEIFKIEVSLLAPIKSSFLHQDALLGHF